MIEESKIFSFKYIALFLGIIFILFASVIIFTRPSICDIYDFTKTGQIGDTIGGITAPIINLIGAILIFISFKTQINANKLQFDLLNQEIENQKFDRNFQISLELFKELKEDFNSLKYKDFMSQSALNVFANEIKSNWTKATLENHLRIPIYSQLKFIISELDLILYQIDNTEFRENEKPRIRLLVHRYYITQLKYATDILETELKKHSIGIDALKLLQGINSALGYDKK